MAVSSSSTDSQKITNANLTEVVSQFLSLLADKEQDIIQRRFSLVGQKKQTLDKIGKSYGITRERVRQIESVALSKLARIAVDPVMQSVHKTAMEILSRNGNIMAEDLLVSEMIREMEGVSGLDTSSIKLAIRVSEKFIKQEKNQFYRAFWRVAGTNISDVRKLIKSVKQLLKSNGDVMSLEDVQKNFRDQSGSVKSVLGIDWEFCNDKLGNWGIVSWRHINPRSIKDKVCLTFQNVGKPLHFSEVVKHVLNDFDSKKRVTHQAIHNELIRHDCFVLVGRGVYALKEWGMPSGTVCDIIRSVLVENGEPMSRQDIISKVLEKREIRLGTISLNLQKHPFFVRVGRAVYEYQKALDVKKQRRRG